MKMTRTAYLKCRQRNPAVTNRLLPRKNARQWNHHLVAPDVARYLPILRLFQSGSAVNLSPENPNVGGPLKARGDIRLRSDDSPSVRISILTERRLCRPETTLETRTATTRILPDTSNHKVSRA